MYFMIEFKILTFSFCTNAGTILLIDQVCKNPNRGFWKLRKLRKLDIEEIYTNSQRKIKGIFLWSFHCKLQGEGFCPMYIFYVPCVILGTQENVRRRLIIREFDFSHPDLDEEPWIWEKEVRKRNLKWIREPWET